MIQRFLAVCQLNIFVSLNSVAAESWPTDTDPDWSVVFCILFSLFIQYFAVVFVCLVLIFGILYLYLFVN